MSRDSRRLRRFPCAFVLTLGTVVAIASTNAPSDCPTEVCVDAGIAIKAKAEVEDISSNFHKQANEGLKSSGVIGGGEVDLRLQKEHASGSLRSRRKRDKVVFIKLHKVGSTTVSNILRRRCDNYGFRCGGVPASDSYIPTVATVTSDELKELAARHAGKYDIWANHAVLDPKLYDILMPGNIKVSVFRNPLDRVISSFRIAAEWFGVEAALQPIRALQQDKWPKELCGFPDEWHNDVSHCCGPTAGLAMSGQIPVEQFNELDFVMLTEHLDMSLIMFRHFVSWELADMLYLRLANHKGTMTSEREAANKKVEEYMRGGNATITTKAGQKFYADCVEGDEAMIYSMAKQKYQQQWDSFSPSEQEELHAEHAVFQKALAAVTSCCSEHMDDAYCVELSETSITWFERHGGSVETPESRPYPLKPNLEMPVQAVHSKCKGYAVNVLYQSSAWQMASV